MTAGRSGQCLIVTELWEERERERESVCVREREKERERVRGKYVMFILHAYNVYIQCRMFH